MALEALNLSNLLINLTFGGILLTFVGLSLIFTIICLMGRLSPIFIFYWLALFTVCYGMIFLGGLVPALFMIIAGVYFFQAATKWYHGGLP